MAAKKPPAVDLVSAICDGSNNFSLGQAADFLQRSRQAVYHLTSQRQLHPVRVQGQLVFSRGDLDRYRRTELEVEVARQLTDGVHPLDIYFEAQGRYPLTEVERVMREWARLTGVWVIEGPRGSYARWLERFGLMSVPPRALRRFFEALLVDKDLEDKVRTWFSDYRKLNGVGEAQARKRFERRYGRLAGNGQGGGSPDVG